MRRELCVIIPAVKKNVAFPDDLVKKLDGVTLISRTINIARALVPDECIYVVTDSEEITLICERENVRFFYKPQLRLSEKDIFSDLRFSLLRLHLGYDNAFLLSPYIPLLDAPIVQDAYGGFKDGGYDFYQGVKRTTEPVFKEDIKSSRELFFEDWDATFSTRIKNLCFFKTDIIKADDASLKLGSFALDESSVVIRNYRDWWVAEKMIQMRRIVFRVIGHSSVGMGHIYRALSLAHEISDHEIIFVCDEESRLAVDGIAGSDYLIHCFPKDSIEEEILALKPDLVINDMLNTTAEYVGRLKNNGISVVNFEDLGPGASHADATLNDLYDSPVVEGKNIRWGHSWFFLRDEFADAVIHSEIAQVKQMLITFGGTDEHDLTGTVLEMLAPYCRDKEIRIHVVTGMGYEHKERLATTLERDDMDHVDFTFATGIMSKIMEQVDIAVTSNGRTTYELCHMNIPSVVISQHEREGTHRFSSRDNGFLNIGVINENTPQDALAGVRTLVENHGVRMDCHAAMQRYDFVRNKTQVVALIKEIL